MSLSPELLALLSAAFLAVASVMIQKGLLQSNFYSGFFISVMVGAGSLAPIFLLLGAYQNFSLQSVLVFAVSGVIGTSGGRLLRFASLAKLGSTLSVPVVNTNPLIATFLSILLLNERVTPAILAGTVLIITGATILSIAGRARGIKATLIILPFASSVFFGVAALLRKAGLAQADPVSGAAINFVAAAMAYSLFLKFSGNFRNLRFSRRSSKYFFLGGVAENFGVLLMFYALSAGQVSIVIPLGGTHPLFLLLLAYVFLHGVERVTGRIILGSVAIVGGIFLILQ